MVGTLTQCGSRAGRAASATRPCGSSTRTALALQGLRKACEADSAFSKRGSRTVKYWAPMVETAERGLATGHAAAGGAPFLQQGHA